MLSSYRAYIRNILEIVVEIKILKNKYENRNYKKITIILTKRNRIETNQTPK